MNIALFLPFTQEIMDGYKQTKSPLISEGRCNVEKD